MRPYASYRGTLRSGPLFALLLLACVLPLAGCGKRPQVNALDKAAVEALLPYEPKYELDNQGRIIDLKLDGKRVDDRALDHVKDLTALRRLSLFGASVTDAGVAKLVSLPQLEGIGLEETQVTDGAFEYLRKMPGLAYLWFSKNGKVTTKGIEAIKKDLPGLTIYQLQR